MKLAQLQMLVSVVDHGNFSEAAIHLNLSQSAISHAIAALEEELGVSLFLRGRYGARLTPVGERITRHARQILDLTQAIQKEANLERGLQSGQVRIACFRSVATHLLPAVIAQFRARYPQLSVSITEYEEYPEVEQALRSGKADLGLTYLPASADFETWEILRDEYVALLPPPRPGDPASPHGSLTWEHLESYPLILDTGNAGYMGIRRHLTQLGHCTHPTYEVREDSTIVSMVAQGLGAAIMPRLAAEPIPPGIQVHSLPVPLERVIGMAMLADILQSPAVFTFLDMFRNTCFKPKPST